MDTPDNFWFNGVPTDRETITKEITNFCTGLIRENKLDNRFMDALISESTKIINIKRMHCNNGSFNVGAFYGYNINTSLNTKVESPHFICGWTNAGIDIVPNGIYVMGFFTTGEIRRIGYKEHEDWFYKEPVDTSVTPSTNASINIFKDNQPITCNEYSDFLHEFFGLLDRCKDVEFSNSVIDKIEAITEFFNHIQENSISKPTMTQTFNTKENTFQIKITSDDKVLKQLDVDIKKKQEIVS